LGILRAFLGGNLKQTDGVGPGMGQVLGFFKVDGGNQLISKIHTTKSPYLSQSLGRNHADPVTRYSIRHCKGT
jgi:hypothetical protein